MGAPVSSAPGEGGEAAGDLRLSPVMSSRQNQAKDFIECYFMRHGVSPTLGEIAAALGTSRKRAHEYRKALVDKGLIEHEPGKARGIRLIDRTRELSENEMLQRLLAEGWTIGDGSRIITPPGTVRTVTENGLFALPILDHVINSDRAGTKDGETDKGRRART